MSEAVRLYRYQSLFSSRRAVPVQECLDTLEISLATFKRDLAKMRDQFGMPIVFDRDRGGYVLQAGHSSPLPGMWFSPQELVALATLQQLLVQLQPGLLAATLEPFKQRLGDLLKTEGLDEEALANRLRITHAGKRDVAPLALEAVATATMRRKRLQVTHFNRQTGEKQPRQISPQRLVLYRDNWYVDAWCHLRDALRSFSVDAMEGVQVLDDAAHEVPTPELDAFVSPSYGIFAGRPTAWATLRFTPERARWVSLERWHPQQEAKWLADGSYELRVPYSDDRELIGDILRFGPDVQVVSPQGLRGKVQGKLLEAVRRYVEGN